MTLYQMEITSRIFGRGDKDGIAPVVVITPMPELSVGQLIAQSVETQIKAMAQADGLDVVEVHRRLHQQYLTAEEIDQQMNNAGAIRYVQPKQDNKVSISAEVSKAKRAFSEGKFLIYVDGEQMDSLKQKVPLSEQTKVTFLRLVPLVGG